MTPKPGLEFAAKTDTGLVRSHNEDCIALSPDCGLAILADGMGGYRAGEVASGMAATVLQQAVVEGLHGLQRREPDAAQIHRLLDESIHRANTAILDAARAEPRYEGMGTTLVAALFHEDTVTIAHVGDSRAYRLRQGELVQITRDHSLLQEQIDAGLISPEWAPFAPHKNLVTRALGAGPGMEVEIHDHRVEADDLYLLCSDGLSDMLDLSEMQRILTSDAVSLDAACAALVQRANDHGGHDNISVILIKMQPSNIESANLLGKIRNWLG